MPYQLQKLTPPQIARLDEVPITRQEQIIDRTGEPLRLVTSYYLVKNASADFTLPHETAEQLDAAIHQLLSRRGFLDGTLQAAPKPEKPQASLPPEKVAQSVQKALEPAQRLKPFSFSQYPLSRKFMPQHQQKAVQGFKEEREAIAAEVEKMLAAIPRPGAQSDKELMAQTVFAHYFYGQSDWFVLSYDAAEDLFFGYVILNGDSELSEAGYFSREELTGSGRVELDFHWKPVALSEALHKADPEFFQIKNDDKAKRLRLAQAKAKAQAARIRILKLKSQKAV